MRHKKQRHSFSFFKHIFASFFLISPNPPSPHPLIPSQPQFKKHSLMRPSRQHGCRRATTLPCGAPSPPLCRPHSRRSAGSKMVGPIKDAFQVRQIGFTRSLCLCPPGVQLLPSTTVDLKTCGGESSITVRAAHKEHEGVYTVRLRTGDHVQEHSAYVYVKGEGNVGVPYL